MAQRLMGIFVHFLSSKDAQSTVRGWENEHFLISGSSFPLPLFFIRYGE